MDKLEVAVFAGGCFWCTETLFKRLNGVVSVVSGYAGGQTPNPNYEQVSSGVTGHAEAVQVQYDSHLITYEDLLNVFFSTHNPTTLNQQGNDVGTQYRSAIFYVNNEQKLSAIAYIEKLEKEKIFGSPIVTEVSMLEAFYPAEQYHQNFYDNNIQYPYCVSVINPKLAKLRQKFAHLLKDK